MALGPLNALVGYHLRRANARFASDFAQTFADTDMRQVLFGILSVVAANPGIRQGTVGKALGIQRTNMVVLVNQLIDRGLVERTLAADDRRAFRLDLTEAGVVAMEGTLESIFHHEERMLSDLTIAERSTLIDLLKRIRPSER